jgi:hypothetical protein
MAGSAIRPELSIMLVVSFMAGIAVTGASLIYVIGMTTHTGGRGVRTG